MRILITGGCGFLGTNLAERVLNEKKDDLIILDNLLRYGSEINLSWLKEKGDFSFVREDIRNTDAIEQMFRDHRPDVVFHLAGQVAMTTSIANPRADFEINVLGTLNVLEAVRKHSPDCIVVYSSTNKVYGDLEWAEYIEEQKRYICPRFPNGFTEQIQLSFHSPYGCSKGAADQYVLDYHRVFKLRTVVFRHSSMYGGRQFSTFDQGWIGWFCSKAIETKNNKLVPPFTISGNGKQVRDVLHSNDMIDLYFASIEHIGKINGEAFNIGGGMKNSLSLLELFDILEEELQIKLNYLQLPFRESDQKVFVADISKYSGATGWQPKVDKKMGVRKMIEWLNE